MTALGHKRKWRYDRVMSALSLKADIRQHEWHVRYVPIADSQSPVRMSRNSLAGVAWDLRVAGFCFDDRNTDRLVLAITRHVAKVNNASRKAKPFHTIINRPDAVGFRQQLHKPAHEIIDPRLIFRGGICLGVS